MHSPVNLQLPFQHLGQYNLKTNQFLRTQYAGNNQYITLEALMQSPWLWKSSSQVEFCSTKKFIIQQSNVSKTSCKDLPAVTDERPSPCSVFSLFYKVHFASYFTQWKKNKKELQILKKKIERPDTHQHTRQLEFLAEQMWHKHLQILQWP